MVSENSDYYDILIMDLTIFFSIFQMSLDNPSNLYFLHHGENPSVMLVTDRLIGENYHPWAKLMTKALNVKNKLEFISEVLKKPIDEASLFTMGSM